MEDPRDDKRPSVEIPGIDQEHVTYIGPNSELWSSEAASMAQQLERQGYSNDEIWQRTGTARDTNGSWMQEVSDYNSRFTRSKFELNRTYKLSDVYDHDDLYASYPELKDHNFVMFDNRTGPMKGAGAYFDRGNTIYMGAYDTNGNVQNQEQMRQFMVHELGHTIEKFEPTFGGSGNMETGREMAQKYDMLSPTPDYRREWEGYASSSGEQRPRDAEQRTNLTPMDRINIPPHTRGFPGDNPTQISSFVTTHGGKGVPPHVRDAQGQVPPHQTRDLNQFGSSTMYLNPKHPNYDYYKSKTPRNLK